MIALLFVTLNLSAEKTADHTKFEILQQDFATAPEVTKACLTCHTNASQQMMKTTHWTWSFKTKSGRKSGKYHVVNNFCVAVQSNEPRCTSCHTGYGWKNTKFDFNKEENVDCLVCHDQSGKYQKFPTAAGHPTYVEKMFAKKKKFMPFDLSEVARSVGSPSRKNCGVCHFNGGGGNAVKHGDMDKSLINPKKELDVHMGGKDMTCIDCHKTTEHEIPGSIYEYHDKESRPTCESCHTLRPHKKTEKLNDHTEKVACQTCHIPAYARGGYATKLWWDWSKAGDKTRENTKTYNFKKGEFKIGQNVKPEYYWHNGDMGNTLPTDKFDPSKGPIMLNALAGGPDVPDSKIYPFKVHRGKQIFDSKYNNFIIPKLFGKKEAGAYWKNYDWNLAAEAGMKYLELPYSGEYSFVETEMNWAITHMVAPKEQSLACNDCHTNSPEGRMQGIEGVYIPGQSHSSTLDMAGLGLVVLTAFGVFVHTLIGFFSKKKKVTEEE